MSNESNIFSKPLVWNSVFENVFRNVFAMNRSAYSVLGFEPGLVLDFDAEYYRLGEFQRQFSDAITHTRASTATYVDSTGTLQTAAINEPRVGHHVWNGSAWVNEGLLHESEARTNLLTYSEDLSNAAWLKTGVTIGTPVTRKGISLDLLTSTGTGTFRDLNQSVGSVSNGAYFTLSVFVEAGTSTENAIRIDDGTATNRHTVPITWTAGVPTLQANVTAGLTSVSASVQDYGDGLYRIHIAALNGTGGALTLNARYYVVWDDSSAPVTVYAGGFQAEIGPTPSSYIPTSGSTVTRAADVLTIPAANLPWPTVAPLALSIQMDGRVTYADTGSFGAVFFYRWISGSNQIYARVNDGGVRVGYIDAVVIADGVTDISTSGVDVTSPNSPQSVSIAARHGSTFVQVAANGVSYAADNTPTVLPDLSAANLLLATTYNGTIRTFRMWAQDIGDAGLVEATEPSLVPSCH
jgi:hypothetical protein